MQNEIEQMAKAVCHLDRTCDECMTSFECKAMMYAKRFYNAGYRKASEVAREIFAEIELKAPFFCENQIAYEHFYDELAELKKKYIGEDTNVTTNTEGEE